MDFDLPFATSLGMEMGRFVVIGPEPKFKSRDGKRADDSQGYDTLLSDICQNGLINLSGCVPNEGSLLRLVLLTATRGRVLGLNWIGVGSLVPRILIHSVWLSTASST